MLHKLKKNGPTCEYVDPSKNVDTSFPGCWSNFAFCVIPLIFRGLLYAIIVFFIPSTPLLDDFDSRSMQHSSYISLSFCLGTSFGWYSKCSITCSLLSIFSSIDSLFVSFGWVSLLWALTDMVVIPATVLPLHPTASCRASSPCPWPVPYLCTRHRRGVIDTDKNHTITTKTPVVPAAALAGRSTSPAPITADGHITADGCLEDGQRGYLHRVHFTCTAGLDVLCGHPISICQKTGGLRHIRDDAQKALAKEYLLVRGFKSSVFILRKLILKNK